MKTMRSGTSSVSCAAAGGKMGCPSGGSFVAFCSIAGTHSRERAFRPVRTSLKTRPHLRFAGK
jgi:hypothetical protein